MSRAHGLPALALVLGALQKAETAPFPETFAAFRELVERGDVEAARVMGEPLAAGAALDETQRAALHFGLGLVRARGVDAALWPDAVGAFQAARALAGAGELRLDATYDAGVVELQTGERLRAQIPEVAQVQGAGAPGGPGTLQQVPPPAPVVPPGAPGAAAQAPGAPAEDPLVLARAAYEQARETLCERLRADWQDVDTRANLELVQRRLRELDEIEERRKEQEQQQQDQQGDEQQDQQEGQDQEKSEQDPSQQDQQSQGQEQQDPEGEREPQEEQQPGEEEEQPEQDPAAEQPTGEKPQELEPPAGEEEAKAAPQAEDSERHLTREEVMRLLDRLAEMEEQGQALEARMRRARREAVERDW